MADIRTPTFYFEDRNRRREKVNEIKVKLDELIIHLQTLKQQPGQTQATKVLVEKELKKVAQKKKDHRRQKATRVIVNKILDDDPDSAIELMVNELAYRIHSRIEPDMKKAGQEMTTHIFGC